MKTVEKVIRVMIDIIRGEACYADPTGNCTKCAKILDPENEEWCVNCLMIFFSEMT